MPNTIRQFSIFVLCTILGSYVWAEQELFLTSGKDRVQLLELYSSEGCSSCPPADAWISELKNRHELWKSFVPVVFHVDYWNYLGWKDGLSTDLMTKRQIEVANLWKNPSVYTPAFVLDGQEWKDWRELKKASVPYSSKATGLVLSIFKNSNGSLEVKTEGQKNQVNYILRFAELGMNISSDVTEGENKGRLLKHNFVILNWESRAVKGAKIAEVFKLKDPNKHNHGKAIAVWIEEAGKPIPLQAVGGYL